MKLEGELDCATDLVLKRFIGNLLDAGRIHVALDLAQLSFTDSSGLSVMLESEQRLERQGGRLALVSPRGVVRRVLEITGLYGAFDVHGSLSTLPMSIPEMAEGAEAGGATRVLGRLG